MVEGIVKQLLDVPYCGPALATRLLVLTRPDLFVIVNEKSFSKLFKRFDVAISDVQFTERTYVTFWRRFERKSCIKVRNRMSRPNESFGWRGPRCLIHL